MALSNKARNEIIEIIKEFIDQDIYYLFYYDTIEFTDWIYLSDWETKVYDRTTYFVKNMKYKPSIKFNDFEKYLLKKYKKELEEIATKNDMDIDFVIDLIFEKFVSYINEIIINNFYESEFVPFIEKLGYKPAVVGRSGGWWGIEIEKNPIDSIYISGSYFEINHKKVNNYVNRIIDAEYSDYNDDDIDCEEIANSIYADHFSNLENFIVINKSFYDDIKKIDDFLNESAKIYSDLNNYDYDIQNIIEKLL